MSEPSNSTRLTEQPVFLIGSERSGSTLLRLMLDHHPDIAFNMESEFLVAGISDAGAFPDVAAYRLALVRNRIFRHSRFVIPENLDFPALVNDFLHQRRERVGKPIVGATVHHGFSRLRYLWPRAKYIYILRDGRDVAFSAVDMSWAGNAYMGVQCWMDAEDEWAGYQKLLAPGQWIEVRYEELVADPRTQLQRVCRLVGVNFSERMFDYAKTSSYSLPNPGAGSKWRTRRQSRQVCLVEARIGVRLVARGYELYCEAPLRIGWLGAWWIRWHSRFGVLQRRTALFGFWLAVLEPVSRRLGWTSVHGHVRDAIDAIIDKTLK
jgi:Sulfotransferase family